MMMMLQERREEAKKIKKNECLGKGLARHFVFSSLSFAAAMVSVGREEEEEQERVGRRCLQCAQLAGLTRAFCRSALVLWRCAPALVAAAVTRVAVAGGTSFGWSSRARVASRGGAAGHAGVECEWRRRGSGRRGSGRSRLLRARQHQSARVRRRTQRGHENQTRQRGKAKRRRFRTAAQRNATECARRMRGRLAHALVSSCTAALRSGL